MGVRVQKCYSTSSESSQDTTTTPHNTRSNQGNSRRQSERRQLNSDRKLRSSSTNQSNQSSGTNHAQTKQAQEQTQAQAQEQDRQQRSPEPSCQEAKEGGKQQQQQQQQQQNAFLEKDYDLLPFLDAEQDHLFLFPEDWHGNSSSFNDASESEITNEIDSLTKQILSKRTGHQHDQLCLFGGCAADYKVEDVDDLLRQAHENMKRNESTRYTLVRRNPEDPKSARVATEDDVKDLSAKLSAAKVKEKTASPSRVKSESKASQSSQHSTPAKRCGSQYKPGGPCDHCGVTESPQWRRGPADKPQLCNACGTRYRRTNTLGSSSSSTSLSSSPSNSRKRDMSRCKSGKAPKEPRLHKSLLVSATA